MGNELWNERGQAADNCNDIDGYFLKSIPHQMKELKKNLLEFVQYV
jgi:hypothetical protein